MKKEVVVDKNTNSIQYFEGEIRLSNFHLNDIVAIGEVTMDVGPFTNDHFIMIITKNKMWNRISTNAIGFDKLISTIGSQLDITSFNCNNHWCGTHYQTFYSWYEKQRK